MEMVTSLVTEYEQFYNCINAKEVGNYRAVARDVISGHVHGKNTKNGFLGA